MEGFPSGQRDQTVNLTAQPSVVRIHLPPPLIPLGFTKYQLLAGIFLSVKSHHNYIMVTVNHKFYHSVIFTIGIDSLPDDPKLWNMC